jgi:hypothetical protein
MSAGDDYLVVMSKEDLIDSRTQKTIVQHNWLKGHEYTSAYGTRYAVVGLLGGGLSESYLAAFKLDAAGAPIRDSYTGRPKVERLATTLVIEQLNKRGIYAPWDLRSKGVFVESPEEVEAMVAEIEIDGMPEEMEEPVIPEVLPKTARELAETKLVASIAGMTVTRNKRVKGQDMLFQQRKAESRSDDLLP